MSPETRSNTSRDREGAEPGEPGVLSPMGGRGWSELRERSRGTGTRRLWGVRVSAKGSQMGSGPCKTGICVKRLIASCRLPVSPVSRGGEFALFIDVQQCCFGTLSILCPPASSPVQAEGCRDCHSRP